MVGQYMHVCVCGDAVLLIGSRSVYQLVLGLFHNEKQLIRFSGDI